MECQPEVDGFLSMDDLCYDLAMDEPLKRAIENAGGMLAFAAALGIRRQAIWKWRRCPAHRIIEVERLTSVPREELRPDLYRVPRPRGRK
jgi:DNA-binding transcriptional regulator YdaS (Cro superfamily)